MNQIAQGKSTATGNRSSEHYAQWSLIAVFYLLAAVRGVRSSQLASVSPLDLLLPLATVVVVGWWAIGDSITRGRPVPLLTRGWFVLLANLTVPAYLIVSRGWRGLGLLFLHAFLWAAVFAATFVCCQMLAVILMNAR